jgi:hypothetical protein
MSGYRSACPACGAEVLFALGTTLLRVCDHCGVAVARAGADVENYGQVAALIPTPSVLALGVEGGYANAPRFRLVGRLQIDHGAGTWDEWLMGFDDGAWAWLSESQGKFHYMGQVAQPPLPDFDELMPGQRVDLGATGAFVVSELRSGRFVSARGELPFRAQPGSVLNYADLSGPDGQFATIDYGQGQEAEALYVGREVTLDELGVSGLPDEEQRAVKASGKNLACTQCGGPLELRAPDLTQRVACPWCGSLLDATRDLKVLAKLSAPPISALIPLGSQGRYKGVVWCVIGLVERSVTVEDERYPWREYLLYEPRRGFRWLVESDGHWSFVEPVNAGDLQGASASGVTYEGTRYKHFQSGQACVDHVLGEFYWAVKRGQTTDTQDYVAPPSMLSCEADEGEITWSRGSYVEPAELWQAFNAPGSPPERRGVGAIQPWPHASAARGVYTSALVLLAVLFVVFLGLTLLGRRQVHTQFIVIPPTAVSGTPEAAVFTEPFQVERTGNLEVLVTAAVDNSWLYLDGALINERTGSLDEFDAEVSFYHGRDSDGSWSEGGTSTRRYISSVEPGRYVLRLEPQWEAGRPAPRSYEVRVSSRVPRLYQLFLAGLALALWPLLLAWRQWRFEAQRWSQSDHPWVESS